MVELSGLHQMPALLDRVITEKSQLLPRAGRFHAAPDGRLWLRPPPRGGFVIEPRTCLSLAFGWVATQLILVILVCLIRRYDQIAF